MDELARDAVQSVSIKIQEIARDPEAYSLFQIAMSDLIEFFADEMETIIRMASGRMPCEPNNSIEQAAYELFGKLETKIEGKVAIAEYGFNAQPALTTPVLRRPTGARLGGRVRHFGMKCGHIVYAFYIGDLKPRTQAEIENAMLEWIESRGLSAATSTVRARARRLWDINSDARIVFDLFCPLSAAIQLLIGDCSPASAGTRRRAGDKWNSSQYR